jgi:hypothetical protein
VPDNYTPNGYFPKTSPAERRAFFDLNRLLARKDTEIEVLQSDLDAAEARILALENKTTTSAWVAPTLLNGWTNYGGAYQVMQYRRVGDMIQLRGVIKGTATNALAFTLPNGFRPPSYIQPTIRVASIAGGYLDISSTSGDCLVSADTSALAAGAVSISVQFPVTP